LNILIDSVKDQIEFPIKEARFKVIYL